ncbi:unnamed protein product [Hyaloperonospora brassicae]|uniref:Uncharacterized protein n=1 Tax=Hyaloperonospora brassicae TaxID=162125 RepID=A0AAV0TZ24_HYABA|nr:unnamed protein product [Hyaloperonospora brassicae]
MDVSFKKRKTKKKTTTDGAVPNKRRRRPSDKSLDDAQDAIAGIGDEAQDVEHVQRRIEELREDQRLRQQLLKAELANHRAEKPWSTRQSATPSATSSYGLHDPKKDGSTSQKLLSLLDGQFTGQSATTDKDQHEELMNQFIDEKLSQIKQQKGGALQKEQQQQQMDEASAALKRAEDRLFELPAHLIPDVSRQNKGTGDGDGTDGGMLLGSAGIAEVELPSMYSEKTVAATRKALERSHRSSGPKLDAIGGMVNTALPANFSVDFNRHRTDYVAEMKSLNRDEQRERGFHQGRKNQASDDRAVSRFRKFESRKLRR